MIRLGLADDEPLHIMGPVALLGMQPDMEIIWRAADGKEALACSAVDSADALLLDVQMPGLSGPAITHELMVRGVAGRVVILTISNADAPVTDAIEAGVSGLLLISTPSQEFAVAICVVHDGSSVISPGPTHRLLIVARTGHVSGVRVREGAGRHASEDLVKALRAAEASQQVVGLTQREREILAFITLGLSDQEICDRRWLPMPTVTTHVSHLLSIAGCRDRIQFVLPALCGGVVGPADVLHLN